MATSLRPSHNAIDAFVPSDDVTKSQPAIEQFSAARPVTRIVVEIGGSAAWLAWQIEADDVLVHEAQAQLRGIGESLDRYCGRMPEELRSRMLAALQSARASASLSDLPAVARSAAEIRALAEQFRALTTTW